MVQRPGIEPGFPDWKSSELADILPLHIGREDSYSELRTLKTKKAPHKEELSVLSNLYLFYKITHRPHDQSTDHTRHYYVSPDTS